MLATTRGEKSGDVEERKIVQNEALRMVVEEHLSFREIGRRLVPPKHPETVRRMVRAALEQTDKENNEFAALFRTRESERNLFWLKRLHADVMSDDPEIKARAIGKSLDVQARLASLNGVDVSPRGATINLALVQMNNGDRVRTAIDEPELLAQLEAAVGQLDLPAAFLPNRAELGFAGDDAIELEAVEQGEGEREEDSE